ncbi:MAG: hypothetical protein GF388_02115, partial [Candidatus Aegiribacteria sp.]|nr:hypothetical protein [Candidatus Aegiribacteria sp.]MBD3294129.1 hypothetical protein [Candidatus Fermentibacteria bacterium]
MKWIIKTGCSTALLLAAAACGGSNGDETAVQPDTSSVAATDSPDSSSPDVETNYVPMDSLPAEVMFSIRENGLGLCLLQGDLPCPNS